jgi:hypothetical protein
MPVLIRHLWQLQTVVFLHWCLIHSILLVDVRNLYYIMTYVSCLLNRQGWDVVDTHLELLYTLGGSTSPWQVKCIDIECLQNRLLIDCYMPATSAGLTRLSFFSFYAAAINSTNEANKVGSTCH